MKRLRTTIESTATFDIDPVSYPGMTDNQILEIELDNLKEYAMEAQFERSTVKYTAEILNDFNQMIACHSVEIGPEEKDD